MARQPDARERSARNARAPTSTSNARKPRAASTPGCRGQQAAPHNSRGRWDNWAPSPTPQHCAERRRQRAAPTPAPRSRSSRSTCKRRRSSLGAPGTATRGRQSPKQRSSPNRCRLAHRNLHDNMSRQGGRNRCSGEPVWRNAATNKCCKQRGRKRHSPRVRNVWSIWGTLPPCQTTSRGCRWRPRDPRPACRIGRPCAAASICGMRARGTAPALPHRTCTAATSPQCASASTTCTLHGSKLHSCKPPHWPLRIHRTPRGRSAS
mmetsp:Transcript_51441/g.148455  ORF Transcript_51441/g.148455 Transcript_51441/m.148455 type:complete len:264 (-) Transcript_51441:35-826(-)